MLLELLAFLAVLAVTVRWVLAPVRCPRVGPAGADLVALEVERDAHVAAVRDAELDLQTGKLTPAEHRALDAELRVAAVTALRALERARAGEDAAR